MFIEENYKKKKENDEIRIEIINTIFRICDTHKLKTIMAFINGIEGKDYLNYPMKITDIASMLEEDDIITVLGVVKNMDTYKIAAKQMKEAFMQALKEKET
ncbi:MAG: hypothetical protein PUJ11_04775 [Eubacteriaceae bacterium]|nr:hypothetical protein [Eubacteriaceae bacterium]